MTEKEYQKLMSIPREKLKRGITKEEALRSFVNAGIMNEKGEFTEFYSDLNHAGHLFEAVSKMKHTDDV